MKLIRQKYYIASLAVLLSVGLVAAIGTRANSFSLEDVTSALGGVFGLNKTEATTQTTPAAARQLAQEQTRATTTETQQLSTTQLSATPVAKVESVTSATSDTGAIVKQVASAQTTRSIAPVSYTSNQISSELRDELFAIAAVVTIIGSAVYAMTYTVASNSLPVVSRRPLYIK